MAAWASFVPWDKVAAKATSSKDSSSPTQVEKELVIYDEQAERKAFIAAGALVLVLLLTILFIIIILN